MKSSATKRIATPDEVMREYKRESVTKEEALDFLYQAGIVTKKGNYRRIYQSSTKTKTA